MIPKPHHLITALLLLLGPLLASTEGNNCHGSTYCKSFTNGKSGSEIQHQLLTSLNETSPSAILLNGQNIACVPGIAGNLINCAICVWVWNTQNTTTAGQVMGFAERIVEHGCGLCGSAYLVDDGRDDVGEGEVTIGWSGNEGGCDGVCNEFGGSDYLPGQTVPSAGGPPAS